QDSTVMTSVGLKPYPRAARLTDGAGRSSIWAPAPPFDPKQLDYIRKTVTHDIRTHPAGGLFGAGAPHLPTGVFYEPQTTLGAPAARALHLDAHGRHAALGRSTVN